VLKADVSGVTPATLGDSDKIVVGDEVSTSDAVAEVVELAEALGRRREALSIETHYVTGGLGSLVAETIAERGLGTRLVRLGVRAGSNGRSGSAAYMQALNGLDRASIVTAARGLIAGIRT